MNTVFSWSSVPKCIWKCQIVIFPNIIRPRFIILKYLLFICLYIVYILLFVDVWRYTVEDGTHDILNRKIERVYCTYIQMYTIHYTCNIYYFHPQKLGALADTLEKKEAQLNEVLSASNLDPTALTVVTRKLEDVLDSKNSAIKDLQYELARVCKVTRVIGIGPRIL